DWFDRGPTVSAVAAVSGDARSWSERIEINSDQAVEGVDQRNGIRPAGLRRDRHMGDVCDIGCELHDHRSAPDLFHPTGNQSGVLGNLADRGSHSALRHSMWTAEVQLQHVGA